MARKIRDSKLESRSARLKLPIRQKPFTGPTLARGISLDYRRNKTNGTWVVKASDGHGRYWTKGFAVADDFEEADGENVLSFFEAQDAARALARGKDNAPDSKPMSVLDALDAYEADLKSRGGRKNNVSRVRRHMTGALGAKPVAALTAQDLRQWRDGLIAKGLKSASVNRTRIGLRAALELAAALDRRIGNQREFKLGLKGIPGATTARRIVLVDDDVRRIVEGAYAESETFGLFVEMLAVTGARMSQVARLNVEDLQADRVAPRVLMPSSFKGEGGQTKGRKRVPVPITIVLAGKLKDAAGDRPIDAPLLINTDGVRWEESSYRRCFLEPFQCVVERAGLDPKITGYALRHSSIVRQLLAGVPTTVVAQLHDTSTKEIERHYAAYISDFADAIARRALLDTGMPAGNVVPLVRVGGRV
jgi:integrase